LGQYSYYYIDEAQMRHVKKNCSLMRSISVNNSRKCKKMMLTHVFLALNGVHFVAEAKQVWRPSSGSLEANECARGTDAVAGLGRGDPPEALLALVQSGSRTRLGVMPPLRAVHSRDMVPAR
jgi:hypothetical protein